MIFLNPLGAPQLACDHCGCRWFARVEGATCYECGSEVTPENMAEYQVALTRFAAQNPNLSQPDR